MSTDPAADARPAACALCIVRIETRHDGRLVVTATWTHDVATWRTSAVRQQLALDQVVDVVETFLAPYAQ